MFGGLASGPVDSSEDIAAAPTAWSKRARLLGTAAVLLYMVYNATLIGLRPEHWLQAALALFLLHFRPATARFFWMAVPLFLVGILYDSLRLFARYRGPVHIEDLYRAELAYFGVPTPDGPMALPMYLAEHTAAFFDLICGLAYLLYLPETLLMAAFLFVFKRDHRRFRQLAWGFFLVNLLGIATWMVYPAAPPWYVMQHGFDFIPSAPPSSAGAARFDTLLGVSVFSSFYSRNANIFGAMPSLHCAYPTLVFWVTRRLGWGYALGTAAFALLVMFSAVYLQHHYVWDVLIGVVYASVTYLLVRYFTRPKPAPEPEQASAGSKGDSA